MLPTIHVRHDPRELLAPLQRHLPRSLPLLRRLQFMGLPGGATEYSHILTSFEGSNLGNYFVVAYLDYSRSPETEMWLFSSLEVGQETEEEVSIGERQLVALFCRAGEIERQLNMTRNTPGVVLLGGVHEKVLEVLKRKQLIGHMTGEPYLKYIFDTHSFPPVMPLPLANLSWGSVRSQDLALVLSRTSIPRKELVTTSLYNSMHSGAHLNISFSYCMGVHRYKPINWITKVPDPKLTLAGVGPDGSLSSLHCEKEYRGKGIAKAITIKLFREHLSKFSLDGLAHADVGLENIQSQAVCQRLGGAASWIVYWAKVRTTN